MAAFPDVTVEVAFASEPLDTTPTYTDVSAFARSISTVIGRSEQFAAYDPGVATVVLDNTERDFDPLHTTGPHYGDLLPSKKIRIAATWGGTEYELFTGFVDGWPQSYDSDGESFTTVVAPDAFKLLGRLKLPRDVYGTVIEADAPRMWYRLNETEGRTLADSSGNGRDISTTLDVSLVAGEGLILSPDGGIDLALGFEAQIPRSYFGGDMDPGTIEFWFVADEATTGNVVGQAFTGGDGSNFLAAIVSGAAQVTAYESTGAIKIVATGFHLITDGVPHHIVMTRSGTTLKIYVDGISRGTSTVLAVGSLTGGLDLYNQAVNVSEAETFLSWTDSPARLDELAFYDSAISAADALAHYQAGVIPWDGDRTGERAVKILDLCGWPAALYDIDTGQSILGPAVWDDGSTLLDYIRLLEATEQGAFYCDHYNDGLVRFRERSDFLTAARSTTVQGIFSDNAGDTGTVIRYSGLDLVYDDTELVNRVDVEWVGGTATATDATSIATYGEQSRTITTLMPSKADAESLASWVLNHYKDVFARIKSITINPAAQSSDSADLAWEQVLERQIGDRINVQRHPRGIGVAIDQDVMIEGIEHQIDNGVAGWSTTFRCGPAEANTYWILGTSELGTDTRLAF